MDLAQRTVQGSNNIGQKLSLTHYEGILGTGGTPPLTLNPRTVRWWSASPPATLLPRNKCPLLTENEGWGCPRYGLDILEKKKILKIQVFWVVMFCSNVADSCHSKGTYHLHLLNTFTAIVDLSRFNNSCLKSPVSTLVVLTFQSRALRSFSLNQLRNLSL